jgi:hypothetical protein
MPWDRETKEILIGASLILIFSLFLVLYRNLIVS